ncbi:2-hydroxyacid dehydrogenase [Thalassobacillus devorans]|uniref:2-hydroxyacid dehydrogenase n=1 Tax=Thalassobacillus devorans TaxID=279813 RepID=UPI0004B3D9F9|nr:2-hydroxyacid dehydrogenase [Thalassobacillus devorans]
MINRIILYFDKTTDEFKDILLGHKPSGFDLLFWHEMEEAEREKILPEADYLLAATYKIGDEIFSKAVNAKLLQKTGIGVDHIDLSSADNYQLPVSNTPGANATAVAELTILMILALYRKLPLMNRSTKSGQWEMWEHRPTSFELEGKTHGLIGFGNIGRQTAKRSHAFGANIIYYDAFRAAPEHEKELEAKYLPLEEVLAQADIISLHIPLLPETKGLIGSKELTVMKQNAILINVARGGIVKEDALYQALKEGSIAGAGIDVWEQEPPKTNIPLFNLDNVIATPHIGAGTRDTLNRVLKTAFLNIQRLDQGKSPEFVVNNVKHTNGNKVYTE